MFNTDIIFIYMYMQRKLLKENTASWRKELGIRYEREAVLTVYLFVPFDLSHAYVYLVCIALHTHTKNFKNI